MPGWSRATPTNRSCRSWGRLLRQYRERDRLGGGPELPAPAAPPVRHRPPLLLCGDDRRRRARARAVAPRGPGPVSGAARTGGPGPVQGRTCPPPPRSGPCPTGRRGRSTTRASSGGSFVGGSAGWRPSCCWPPGCSTWSSPPSGISRAPARSTTGCPSACTPCRCPRLWSAAWPCADWPGGCDGDWRPVVGGHHRGAGGHHHRPTGPGTLPRGSTLALLFCLWLLLEHQHFRVRPTGVSRLFIWAAAAGLVVIGATAGIGNWWGLVTTATSMWSSCWSW